MSIVIEQIEYYLPEGILTNDDLAKENPLWEMDKVALKTGVYSRHIAGKEETALDLSVHACEKLFKKTDKEKIDALIYCTQSPDYIMPPNAYLIHKHFNFRENIVAFDINQACSGFIYGLYLAKSLILSGSAASVLIINADTYSKYIHKNDRSTRALFGDGASATLISSSDSCKGIIDSLISSCGKEYQSFYIPAGGCRMPFETADKKVKEDENGNSRTDLDIYMNGMGVLSFFRNKVSVQIKELLKKHDLVVEDIDLFVFHQASKVALDSIAAALKIKQEKIYSNIKNIGNIVSASIPVALKCAMQENRIGQGHKIIISGFGVGLSWGSILIEL